MQVQLVRQNGVLKISVNGELIEPLSFKSFRPTARNISDFASAGVKLFSILSSGLNSILTVPYSLFGESWIGDHTYNFDVIDRQIELFRQNAPGCYFALMIQLDTRSWWLQTHPAYTDSFRNLSQMAAGEAWRQDGADYLQAVLRHVEDKYGECFYGYFLLCGTTTEWFSHFDEEASFPIKESAFGRAIPPKEIREQPKEEAFVTDQTLADYRKFHAELIANSLLFFARKAQEVLQHKKLLGVYFGYLFELDGPRLWNDGHLAYEQVYFSPDIDMISSPSSYSYRGKDSTSAFMVTYDTLNLHDKLYYLEFDHITHVAPATVEGILIPGGDSKCKNQTETLNLMHRDFLLCRTKGAALWWFDMFEGWFYSQEMMGEIKRMIALNQRLSNLPTVSCAEICVFAEGEALYEVNKNSELNTACLGQQREGLARMGAPYDVFSIGDIGRVDISRYKLVLFSDQFRITEETQAVIDSMKVAGKQLLFLYAPGYVTTDGFSREAMETLTGMEISELSGEETEIDAEDCSWEFPFLPHPLFSPNDGEVLANYRLSGEPAVARKDNVFYSAVGNLPGTLLRRIAKAAGVHIYCETAPVYVCESLVGVYAHKDTTLTLPFEAEAEDVLNEKTYETHQCKITLPAGNYASKLLVIRKKETL